MDPLEKILAEREKSYDPKKKLQFELCGKQVPRPTQLFFDEERYLPTGGCYES